MSSAPSPPIPAKTHPLQIGILCNNGVITRWQEKCIDELRKLDFVRISFIISNTGGQGGKSGGFWKKLTKLTLYRVYMKLLNIEAYRTIAISKVLPETEVLKVTPVKKGKYSDYIAPDDLAEIAKRKPDALLRFGFRILRGDILELAPYGVWSYHHSDETIYRGGPPCFWEIYRHQPVTGAILQKLTEHLDGGVILKRGNFPTSLHSHAQTVNTVMFGSSPWVKQLCIDLHHGKTHHFRQEESASGAMINKSPKSLQVISFLLKIFFNKCTAHLKSLFATEFWRIGILKRPIHTLISDPQIKEVHWMPASKGSSYNADPFGFYDGKEYYLLHETFDYKGKQAWIGLSVLDEDLRIRRKEVLIRSGKHLSYPFILEHEGNIYMLPENNFENQTHLYQWDRQQKKFEKVSELLENSALIDGSLVYYNGKWWLFGTFTATGSRHQLYLFYADRLTDQFTPHLNNPVKTDIASARPAGTPFVYNEKLYRPAQDCSTTYGARVILHEVTEISTAFFEEKSVSIIAPEKRDRYNKGLHTIAPLGSYTLIDAKTYKFDFHNFVRQFSGKVAQRFRRNA